MGVRENGQLEAPVGVAIHHGFVAHGALHQAPSEVESTRRSGRLHADFFPINFTDVSDEFVSGQAVETPAPRVPETIRPDLVEGIRVADKRVAFGDGVRIESVDIDAQELAEQCLEVLPVSDGAVVVTTAAAAGFSRSCAAAVACADVQVAIERSKVKLAAIVSTGRLHELKDLGPRIGVGRGAVLVGAEAHEPFVDERAGAVGTVTVVDDVEQAIGFEVGVQDEVVQALLAHDAVITEVQSG